MNVAIALPHIANMQHANPRVAFAVEVDIALDPAHVGFLGAPTVITSTYRLVHLSQEPRARRLTHGSRRHSYARQPHSPTRPNKIGLRPAWPICEAVRECSTLND